MAKVIVKVDASNLDVYMKSRQGYPHGRTVREMDARSFESGLTISGLDYTYVRHEDCYYFKTNNPSGFTSPPIYGKVMHDMDDLP